MDKSNTIVYFEPKTIFLATQLPQKKLLTSEVFLLVWLSLDL